ncbi:MAG: hypothetical protein GY703_21610 [Gammaproteobacteria bacterium]|nr:hypothetical protein [Gammaproteobacteria bacterium]
MESSTKPGTFGVSGSVIGLLALIVAVLHFYLGPIADPERVEIFIAEKTVNIKNAISAKLKGEEYAVPERPTAIDPDLLVVRGTMMAVLLALSFGVFGFLRKEEHLPSGLALGLGGATVVFSISIAIAGIFVAIIIIAAIVGALGFDGGV